MKNDLISSHMVNSIGTFMFQGEVSTNLDYVFVSVLVPEIITHSVVLICPVLHGNFVEGFHTNRTGLDVPAKKIFPG